VLDNVSDAFVALDTSWRYVYVNRRAAEMLGTTPERMLGENIWTLFPDGAEASFAEVYETAVREQRSMDFEDYFAPADRWFRNRVLPSPGGLTIFIEDVTERRRMQARQDDTDVGSQVARAWFAGLTAAVDPVRAVQAAADAVVATGQVSGMVVDAAGVRVVAGTVDGVPDVRPVVVGERRLGQVVAAWPDGSRAWTGELTVMLAQAVAARLAPGGATGDRSAGEGG
jgi:PAS domain S-box-containing protein